MWGLGSSGLAGNAVQPRLDRLDWPGLGVLSESGVTLPTLAKIDLLTGSGERNFGAGIPKGSSCRQTCIRMEFKS
jgi:hypothetical protein